MPISTKDELDDFVQNVIHKHLEAIWQQQMDQKEDNH